MGTNSEKNFWLKNYVCKADVAFGTKDGTDSRLDHFDTKCTCRGKFMQVKEKVCALTSGCYVYNISDNDVYLPAIFTRESIQEACEEDEDIQDILSQGSDDISDSDVLLQHYVLEFVPDSSFEKSFFRLVILKFKICNRDGEFRSKKSPDSCLSETVIRNRAWTLWHKSRESQSLADHQSQMSSAALTQLLANLTSQPSQDEEDTAAEGFVPALMLSQNIMGAKMGDAYPTLGPFCSAELIISSHDAAALDYPEWQKGFRPAHVVSSGSQEESSSYNAPEGRAQLQEQAAKHRSDTRQPSGSAQSSLPLVGLTPDNLFGSSSKGIEENGDEKSVDTDNSNKPGHAQKDDNSEEQSSSARSPSKAGRLSTSLSPRKSLKSLERRALIWGNAASRTTSSTDKGLEGISSKKSVTKDNVRSESVEDSTGNSDQTKSPTKLKRSLDRRALIWGSVKSRESTTNVTAAATSGTLSSNLTTKRLELVLEDLSQCGYDPVKQKSKETSEKPNNERDINAKELSDDVFIREDTELASSERGLSGKDLGQKGICSSAKSVGDDLQSTQRLKDKGGTPKKSRNEEKVVDSTEVCSTNDNAAGPASVNDNGSPSKSNCLGKRTPGKQAKHNSADKNPSEEEKNSSEGFIIISSESPEKSTEEMLSKQDKACQPESQNARILQSQGCQVGDSLMFMTQDRGLKNAEIQVGESLAMESQLQRESQDERPVHDKRSNAITNDIEQRDIATSSTFPSKGPEESKEANTVVSDNEQSDVPGSGSVSSLQSLTKFGSRTRGFIEACANSTFFATPRLLTPKRVIAHEEKKSSNGSNQLIDDSENLGTRDFMEACVNSTIFPTPKLVAPKRVTPLDKKNTSNSSSNLTDNSEKSNSDKSSGVSDFQHGQRIDLSDELMPETGGEGQGRAIGATQMPIESNSESRDVCDGQEKIDLSCSDLSSPRGTGYSGGSESSQRSGLQSSGGRLSGSVKKFGEITKSKQDVSQSPMLCTQAMQSTQKDDAAVLMQKKRPSFPLSPVGHTQVSQMRGQLLQGYTQVGTTQETEDSAKDKEQDVLAQDEEKEKQDTGDDSRVSVVPESQSKRTNDTSESDPSKSGPSDVTDSTDTSSKKRLSVSEDLISSEGHSDQITALGESVESQKGLSNGIVSAERSPSAGIEEKGDQVENLELRLEVEDEPDIDDVQETHKTPRKSPSAGDVATTNDCQGMAKIAPETEGAYMKTPSSKGAMMKTPLSKSANMKTPSSMSQTSGRKVDRTPASAKSVIGQGALVSPIGTVATPNMSTLGGIAADQPCNSTPRDNEGVRRRIPIVSPVQGPSGENDDLAEHLSQETSTQVPNDHDTSKKSSPSTAADIGKMYLQMMKNKDTTPSRKDAEKPTKKPKPKKVKRLQSKDAKSVIFSEIYGNQTELVQTTVTALFGAAPPTKKKLGLQNKDTNVKMKSSVTPKKPRMGLLQRNGLMLLPEHVEQDNLQEQSTLDKSGENDPNSQPTKSGDESVASKKSSKGQQKRKVIEESEESDEYEIDKSYKPPGVSAKKKKKKKNQTPSKKFKVKPQLKGLTPKATRRLTMDFEDVEALTVADDQSDLPTPLNSLPSHQPNSEEVIEDDDSCFEELLGLLNEDLTPLQKNLQTYRIPGSLTNSLTSEFSKGTLMELSQ